MKCPICKEEAEIVRIGGGVIGIVCSENITHATSHNVGNSLPGVWPEWLRSFLTSHQDTAVQCYGCENAITVTFMGKGDVHMECGSFPPHEQTYNVTNQIPKQWPPWLKQYLNNN